MPLKELRKLDKVLYHYDHGRKILGTHGDLTGNTDNLYGECSRLSGHCEEGLVGDCSLVEGICTGIVGNLEVIKHRIARIEDYVVDKEGAYDNQIGDRRT
jgi:hypothetical protein